MSAEYGRRAADRRRLARLVFLAASVAMVPILGGCSASSPFSSQAGNPPSSQMAAVPPPPNYPVAANGQPGYAPPVQTSYAPPPGQPGYAPPQAQPGYPAPYTAAAAPPPQGSSFRQSYVNFLQMFRDPPDADSSAQPGYNARASIYPQQSLAESFHGSTDPNQRPDPTAAGYPQQSLIGNSAQRAYVPRPPSTYTASQPPYVPPQGQPVYTPAAQQNYAPASAQPAYNAPRSGQQSYVAPAARQPVYSAPPAAPTAAAAPPAQPQQDYSDSLPYPKQSLAELFRGSTGAQTVPHPPSTYTPSGQPYSPSAGQPAYGAPPPATAAATPPASDPSDSLPYPKQSLFDALSSK